MSQTNDAGKSHWSGIFLHFWGAILKIKILISDPSQFITEYDTRRSNQIFRINISKTRSICQKCR